MQAPIFLTKLSDESIIFISDVVKKIFCSTLSEFEFFNKCHNLSKRNVKLILKILNDWSL
jgi:hypothetical protein